MEAHEWMLRSTYQQEWITQRGILLWLAMYAGGLGGGLYLVSLYFNSFIGMLVSLLIVAGLKGGFHFAYLGKPLRFWRIMFRPRTSWLTRGFIFVVLFVGFAAIQLMLAHWLPGTVWEILFKVLAGLMAVGPADTRPACRSLSVERRKCPFMPLARWIIRIQSETLYKRFGSRSQCQTRPDVSDAN